MRVMLWVGSALAVVSVVFSAFMPVVRALDTTPPTIHDLMFDPPRSLAGGSVRIYAWVTDDTAVTDVAANVTRPDGNHENDTMYGPPAYIFYIGGTRNTSLVGTYVVVVWAMDGAGNAASKSGSFEVTALNDTMPPTIANVVANPPRQVPGGAVTVSATITDETRVAETRVVYTLPDGTKMIRLIYYPTTAGNQYWDTIPWNEVGTYGFAFWACDPYDLCSWGPGSFTVGEPTDTTPPTISPTQPSGAYVNDLIPIAATVTDNDRVREVRLLYTPVGGVEQNVTMTPTPGGVYVYNIPAQADAGTVRYRIYAADGSGNAALSSDYAVAVTARVSPPAPSAANLDVVVGLLGLLVFLNVLGLAAVAILVRRERRPEGSSPPNQPTAPP